MNGYAAAVRQFYDIYRPIARKYGLRMCKTIEKHIKSHCRNLGSYQKSRSEKKKSENNMLFLAAAARVATAQTMWKHQTHAQEK